MENVLVLYMMHFNISGSVFLLRFWWKDREKKKRRALWSVFPVFLPDGLTFLRQKEWLPHSQTLKERKPLLSLLHVTWWAKTMSTHAYHVTLKCAVVWHHGINHKCFRLREIQLYTSCGISIFLLPKDMAFKKRKEKTHTYLPPWIS